MKRKTSQHLAPVDPRPTPPGEYDLYPGFPVGSGKIQVGYTALAESLVAAGPMVIIDGYLGVLWEEMRRALDQALAALGVRVAWRDVASALRPAEEIDGIIAPFLGGDDPIFGTRYPGTLRDFFDADKLAALTPDPDADLNIVYGCGAALAGRPGTLVYVDVPKNEIQFRARAGAVTNLGATASFAPKPMYKRMYFVDWIVLNKHKAELLPDIDFMVDGQRDEPLFTAGDVMREALARMSRTYFRVRPWFEPGAWGGQWIKEKIPALAQDVPNYAWSFELIVPENGLMLESDGRRLEFSFDCLMFQEHAAVLGDCADQFGYEFPIRFDFLDTFDGGNLSIQCHPRPEFIRQEFGETFTQDETYYLLDCAPDAEVYLGFQPEIDPAEFRAALEESVRTGQELAIKRFVNTEPAQKHGLYLIPNGTIHCSGVNTMVLEISATPYIFTFKMYDWMRLDLDGRPRPLNIERAFANLYFDRRGDRIAREFVSHPVVLAEGDGLRLEHLPTHAEHFYDVHRMTLQPHARATISTNGSVHILSLVDGPTVSLTTASEMTQTFSYIETFVVPAAAGEYQLHNPNDEPIMVVTAFVKTDYDFR